METRNAGSEPGRKISRILIFSVLILSLLGCEGQKKKEKTAKPPLEQFDKTVGELVEAFTFNPIPVKGIGLVVGLSTTGSSECPPAVRDYLRQYILVQVGRQGDINPNALINSLNTAVVFVEGFIPPAAVSQDNFDVKVSAMPGTQTTSLEGGRLYTTDLKLISRIEDVITASKTLALAAGTLYIDNIAQTKPDKRTGYVLGGGIALQQHQIMLAILNPDFRTAAIIRDRINSRFDRNTANAVSESIIYLNLPQKFEDKKLKFIQLVKSLYIGKTTRSEIHHINDLIKSLQSASLMEKQEAETGLEAIGKPIADRLLPLLASKDIQTKFLAARCLLNIGDDRALKFLRDFTQDPTSQFRIAAIEAIGDTAAKQDAVALMSRLVCDKDYNVRYAAYKYLAKYNDSSIISTVVAKDFYVDQVIQTSPKTVYVSRHDQPRIVLFGAPVSCEENIFIESDDGQIIINALPDEKRISVMRKHPVTGELMGPLKTTYNLADVIRILGGEPAPEDTKERVGLGIPYSQVVELLKKMCENGAVKANFAAGPMTPLAQPPQQPSQEPPPTNPI